MIRANPSGTGGATRRFQDSRSAPAARGAERPDRERSEACAGEQPSGLGKIQVPVFAEHLKPLGLLDIWPCGASRQGLGDPRPCLFGRRYGGDQFSARSVWSSKWPGCPAAERGSERALNGRPTRTLVRRTGGLKEERE